MSLNWGLSRPVVVLTVVEVLEATQKAEDRVGSHLSLVGDEATVVSGKNEPATIKKPDVYQLAGYVLLDFDDTHRIDRVGIYWTRHGVMRTFTVSRFFELLGATAPIADLRDQLHNELPAYEDHVRRARAARLAAEERSVELEQPVAIEQLPLPEDTRLARSVRWLRGVLRR